MNDHPIRVGSCLFTMVDPNPGHEVEYNRWYGARPLLRRLHDRPLAVRRQPLGSHSCAERHALPRRHPVCGARRCRLVSGHLLDA